MTLSSRPVAVVASVADAVAVADMVDATADDEVAVARNITTTTTPSRLLKVALPPLPQQRLHPLRPHPLRLHPLRHPLLVNSTTSLNLRPVAVVALADDEVAVADTVDATVDDEVVVERNTTTTTTPSRLLKVALLPLPQQRLHPPRPHPPRLHPLRHPLLVNSTTSLNLRPVAEVALVADAVAVADTVDDMVADEVAVARNTTTTTMPSRLLKVALLPPPQQRLHPLKPHPQRPHPQRHPPLVNSTTSLNSRLVAVVALVDDVVEVSDEVDRARGSATTTTTTPSKLLPRLHLLRLHPPLRPPPLKHPLLLVTKASSSPLVISLISTRSWTRSCDYIDDL